MATISSIAAFIVWSASSSINFDAVVLRRPGSAWKLKCEIQDWLLHDLGTAGYRSACIQTIRRVLDKDRARRVNTISARVFELIIEDLE